MKPGLVDGVPKFLDFRSFLAYRRLASKSDVFECSGRTTSVTADALECSQPLKNCFELKNQSVPLKGVFWVAMGRCGLTTAIHGGHHRDADVLHHFGNLFDPYVCLLFHL